jgi:hypothetical protein
MAIDIFRRLILQGGFQGSSTNFMEWVPVPIVYNTMNYALAEFNSLSFAEKRAFVHKFKTEFFIANYEDNDIVPNAKKKYIASNFPFKKKARLLNESMSSKEIETRKKDGKKVWAARPTLIGESNLPEDLTVIKDHKNNHIHMGYGEIYPHVHNKISLEHPIFETKYKPLPKKTIFDKLYIDSNQIEKIKSGKQTVLTLKEMLEPGTYELPDGTVIYVVRTSYTESIKEFRSADNWAKAMGYSNLQDLKSNNEYEYINDFVEDKPDSGVFTSFIELSGDKVEIERPQVKTYTGKIKSLKDNQVFVFGSNPVGINGNPKTGTGGAALVATQNNWVEQSEKMDNRLSNSGKAYGLVTVTYPGRKNSLTLNEISQNVKQLYEFARNNPDKEFLVAYTAGGRNLNGYTDAEMAEAFSGTKIPSNVVFEDKFAEMLTGDVQAVKDTAPTTNLKQTIKLRKIISGGQYGIDLMGIEVGKELGFETGGVATRGYRVEGGFNPGLKDYGLTESNYANYLVRTEQNVIDSDGTILFGNMSSSGSKSTIGFLNKHGKPYIVNPNAQEIANFVRNKKVVNIAGNRKSKLSEKQLEDFRTTLREGLGIVKSERDSAINSNVGNAHENC